MSPNIELKSLRRNQILDAALKEIAAHGCANITMEDVCRSAGLSKGGLAHYYRSKNELFKAAFAKFFAQIFQRGEETMARHDDPLDKLLSFVWLYDPCDPDVPTGYPILFDFMAVAVHDPDYRDLFEDWIDNWVCLLKKALEEGRKQGHFQKVDPERTARSISAIYQGIATRWYLAPEKHPTNWAIDTLLRSVTGLLKSYENNE